MKSFLNILLICIIVLFVMRCASLWEDTYEAPTVLLASHDKAGRCRILVKDLDLDVHFVPYGPLPYSENSTSAIWIGTHFPYKKAIDVLNYCRNYYPQIKYFAFSDHTNPGRNRGKYELFVGAPTDRALCLGLRAFSLREKKKLLSSRSKEAFVKIIQSKYDGPKNCL